MGVIFHDSAPHVLVTLMAAYVGLDPVNDIEWVDRTRTSDDGERFVEGKIDAFLGQPPEPQELRPQKIGHTILNTTIDRAVVAALLLHDVRQLRIMSNRYPVATKHILRAILKAADFCASDPSLVAQQLVDRGFVTSYDYALQTLNDIRYDRWREYDAEASMRFYALRMHEDGHDQVEPARRSSPTERTGASSTS